MRLLKSINHQIISLLLLVSAAVVCFSCASVHDAEDVFDDGHAFGIEIHSFGTGFTNGLFLPFALFAKVGSILLGYWDDVALWESLTDGIPYWFGYLCGNLILAFIVTKAYKNIFYFSPAKRFATYFSPFLFVYLAVLIWGDIPKPQLPKLTRSEMVTIFSYHSPEDGARYYVQRHKYYDYMDGVYCDSIIPVLLEGSYQDAKKVNSILHGTPAGDVFAPLFKEMRYNYQQLLYNELDSLTSELKVNFIKDINMYMPMVIDSVLTADVDAIIESYSGGLFDYKKFVLWWNSGENFKKFESLVMNRMAQSSLEEDVNKFLGEYISVLLKSYSDCHLGLFGDSLIVHTPEFPKLLCLQGDINNMENEVESLSSDEANAYTLAFMKDVVIPTALAVASGGTGVIVSIGYDVADMGIEVADLIKDFKDPELSFEEKLKLYLVGKLNEMVTVDMATLNQIACACFDHQNEMLKSRISENI